MSHESNHYGNLAEGGGTEVPPPFVVKPPSGSPGPFLFTVPHSGRYYPPSLKQRSPLGGHMLRLAEDAYVDHLFADVPKAGAALLIATHARSYLDLNRADNELDPTMFTPVLNGGSLNISHRVKAGLGLIPKQVAEGLNIYADPLPAREAMKRIEALHRPYHAKLRDLIDARLARHGWAVLIDCHSMPSEAAEAKKRQKAGPDIVLGDCWGTSAGRELAALAEDLLVRAGFSVRRNVPYSGGYVTRHYGNPGRRVHALQIEINRAIYMDEDQLEPHDGFNDVKARLNRFSTDLMQSAAHYLPQGITGHLPRAAE